MAIPDNYIDHFNKDGDKRYISPAADKVRVDNENFEGADLDEVLDEISESIGEAGQVNEIIMNGQPYTPTNKVIDLGTVITQHQNISGKVDKVTGKGLSTNDFTNELLTKLNGLSNYNDTALQTAVANLQSALQNVYTKSQTYSKSEVDVAIAAASSGAVSVTSNQDGTFTIHVGDTDYTINLNHSHPQYASKKTVTNTNESTVTLSADVIYDLGTVAGNKTINLPSTVDDAAEYEFRFSYTSGDITLPSGVAVANDATFSPTAGKTYQVVICGGILYFSETTISV